MADGADFGPGVCAPEATQVKMVVGMGLRWHFDLDFPVFI